MDELQELRNKLEQIKAVIEKECVYDEHLQGYCFDLPRSKVRSLMLMLKETKGSED